MGNWKKLPVTADKGFILLCTVLDTTIAPMIVGIVKYIDKSPKSITVPLSTDDPTLSHTFELHPEKEYIDYYAKPAKACTLEELIRYHNQEHIRWQLIEMPPK